MIEERQAESAGAVGAVCAAPVVRWSTRLLLRVAVLAGLAVTAWLLCGSTASYADSGVAGGPDAGPPAVLDGDLSPASSLSVVSAQTLHPVTTIVNNRASLIADPIADRLTGRIASRITGPVGRRVPDLARAARAIAIPVDTLVRPLSDAMSTPVLRPLELRPLELRPLELGSLTEATGSVAGSVEPVTDWLDSADGQPGSAPRPSVAPRHDARPAPRSVPAVSVRPITRPDPAVRPDPAAPMPTLRISSARASSRRGPARSPDPEPGGEPLSIPAVPPAPVGAGGQDGPAAASGVLPADDGPDTAPRVGWSRRRTATSALQQRADDPSVAPD